MWIPGQWKIDKIFQRMKSTGGIKFLGPRIPAQDLRDLDIEQMGCVKGFAGIEQAFRKPHSDRGIQQHLDHDRSIDDDQRPSRSTRTALAGEMLGAREGRRARRFFSSLMVGRSATRRTSCRR